MGQRAGRTRAERVACDAGGKGARRRTTTRRALLAGDGWIRYSGRPVQALRGRALQRRSRVDRIQLGRRGDLRIASVSGGLRGGRAPALWPIRGPTAGRLSWWRI